MSILKDVNLASKIGFLRDCASVFCRLPNRIGRRYFKPDFKFWGYVRRPNQPWSTAQLVMLNEKQKLAPDRAALKFGEDNNYEYKLYGNFSGDKVYEPASNRVYPEFILKDYEVISTNPPPPPPERSRLTDRHWARSADKIKSRGSNVRRTIFAIISSRS